MIVPGYWINNRKLMMEKAQKNPGYASGFKTLDLLTGGFHASELIVLASRPGMSKTILALNILKHAAIDENNTCMMLSLERDKEHLLNDLYTIDSGIDAKELESDEFGVKERICLKKSAVRVRNSRLVIDDMPCKTVADIQLKCKALAGQEHVLKLLVIDHLQLIGTDHRDSREEELTEIVKELKQLAVDIQCPVIVLVQLPNTLDRRSDKRPGFKDLKDITGIKQYVDTVLFLHRDEHCRSDSQENKKDTAEIIIAKSSAGCGEKVVLEWQPQTKRFVDDGNLLWFWPVVL